MEIHVFNPPEYRKQFDYFYIDSISTRDWMKLIFYLLDLFLYIIYKLFMLRFTKYEVRSQTNFSRAPANWQNFCTGYPVKIRTKKLCEV